MALSRSTALARPIALALMAASLAACAPRTQAGGMESMMRPIANGTPTRSPNAIVLRGTFVKLTGFPCHRSDPYVGGETVTFAGSDGSRTTIVTGSANWIGLPATSSAPLGQCRQVAPFTAELSPAALRRPDQRPAAPGGHARRAPRRGPAAHVPPAVLRPRPRSEPPAYGGRAQARG
jgi:hypothetical protein